MFQFLGDVFCANVADFEILDDKFRQKWLLGC